MLRIKKAQVLAAIALAVAVVVLGLGLGSSPADANPPNTGGTISGCTYCHTGRIPKPPPPTNPPTTATTVDPEDEGSDQFKSRLGADRVRIESARF